MSSSSVLPWWLYSNDTVGLTTKLISDIIINQLRATGVSVNCRFDLIMIQRLLQG